MSLRAAKRAIQLTPRQHQLLKMVACYQESRCYSPTLGEMASELNLSRSTVFEHVTELRKKGLLCAWPNRARSLTLTLEVTGDSMIGEDIREGDYVICRRSRVADNGQLVIAIVDSDNATLKRFYKEKTRARLQPANEDYEPIYSDNCRVEAVVIGLVRKL
ncbi:MAG: S24 family peptidase [Sedimentisphaerales bacterium]